VREGDVVIVWKLDRLGRSLKDLSAIVAGLKERGIGFRSLTETVSPMTLWRALHKTPAGLTKSMPKGAPADISKRPGARDRVRSIQ
jgi:hypothetical protein